MSEDSKMSGCRQELCTCNTRHRKGTKESWYHKEARRAKPGKMQTVFIKRINRSDLPAEVFLRVLLACLVPVSWNSLDDDARDNDTTY